MSKSKFFTIVIAVTLLAVAAGICFQALEMKDFRLFDKRAAGK